MKDPIFFSTFKQKEEMGKIRSLYSSLGKRAKKLGIPSIRDIPEASIACRLGHGWYPGGTGSVTNPDAIDLRGTPIEYKSRKLKTIDRNRIRKRAIVGQWFPFSQARDLKSINKLNKCDHFFSFNNEDDPFLIIRVKPNYVINNLSKEFKKRKRRNTKGPCMIKIDFDLSDYNPNIMEIVWLDKGFFNKEFSKPDSLFHLLSRPKYV